MCRSRARVLYNFRSHCHILPAFAFDVYARGPGINRELSDVDCSAYVMVTLRLPSATVPRLPV